jgi:pyruvate/2-oxoglutarate dehydrogenase complex dihydrolipoamide acyltransferase (E2) component
LNRRNDVANAIEIKVPDIGNYSGVPVIEILIKPGDSVKKDQGIVTLESDKATMEVPSPAAGVIKEIKVKLGDEVGEGALIALLESAEAATAAPAPAQAAKAAPAPVAAAPAPSAAPAPKAAAASGRTADFECQVVVLGRPRRLHRGIPRRRPGPGHGPDRALFRRSAASASTSAAFPPRRCCMRAGDRGSRARRRHRR